LDSSIHDEVGFVERLSGSLALKLPTLLHGEDTKHDGLGAPNGASAHGIGIVIMAWDVEEASDHGNASVLDICNIQSAGSIHGNGERTGGNGIFLQLLERHCPEMIRS
jgi:hypothetical protein